jgi:hypothetical protein
MPDPVGNAAYNVQANTSEDASKNRLHVLIALSIAFVLSAITHGIQVPKIGK